MTTEEILEIITAYKNGKTIEYFDGGLNKWKETPNPLWSFAIYKYRIKPEPKYIPFDFNDELVGKVVIHRDAKLKGIIFMQEIDTVQVSDKTYSYSQLKQFYTFLDGSPCSKLV